MNKRALIILGVVLLAAVAGGFWFLQKNDEQENTVIPVQTGIQDNQKDVEVVANNNIDEEELEESQITYNGDGTIDTSDWKTYRNEEYGFEIKYPNNLYAEQEKVGFPLIYDTSKEVMFIFDKKMKAKNNTISWQYYWISYVEGDGVSHRENELYDLDKNLTSENSMNIEKNNDINSNGVSYSSIKYCPNFYGAFCDVQVSEYFINMVRKDEYIHIRTNSWYFDKNKEQVLNEIIQTFKNI